jgi:hypothetical protein
MCTVTAVSTRETIRLVCNRDELRSRPTALAPRTQQFGLRRAVLPLDTASGGTWVAVNDVGLAMILVNVNPKDKAEDIRLLARSRGSIIPSFLPFDTLAQVLSGALALDSTLYAPFRLLIADREELAELRSDGRQIQLVGRTSITEPLFFTSSGLGDHLVEEPRRRLFDEMMRRPGDPVAHQDLFHRHRWPESPELSVCMERADARTVSQTVVSLGEDRATLTYHPDAPDRPAEPVAVSLDLRAGGAR